MLRFHLRNVLDRPDSPREKNDVGKPQMTCVCMCGNSFFGFNKIEMNLPGYQWLPEIHSIKVEFDLQQTTERS